MTALIVIATIIAVFTAILSLSITVYVTINEETTVKLGLLCCKKTLMPEKENKKENKKQLHKKSKPKTAKKSEQSKKHTVSAPKNKASFTEMLNFSVEILKAIMPDVADLVRHIRIVGLKLNMTIGKNSADETAISYGQISAGIYNALALTDKAMVLKVKYINISPDFVRGENSCDISFKAKLRLARIIKDAAGILVKGLGKIVKLKPAHKQETGQSPRQAANKDNKTENSKTKSTNNNRIIS